MELEETFKPENSSEYKRFSPIPCGFDLRLSSFMDIFVKATKEEQSFIISSFSDDYSSTFFLFSERMACLAVRERSEKYLFEGLIAHAIEGAKFDWRENILVLSLIYHSAVKIGVDPVTLFKRASEFAEEPIAHIIHEFPDRKPEDRSIEAMGYIESSDKDGFKYKRTW